MKMSQTDGVFVCNIKPLIYFYVFNGMYHNVSKSNVICSLLKLYCIIISSLLLGVVSYWTYLISYNITFAMVLEYILYVFFGLYGKDTYMYLKATHTDDLKAFKNTYKRIQTVIISITILTLVLKTILRFLFLIEDRDCLLCHIFLSYFGFFILISRLKFVYMFLMLYFRVKCMRISLENSKGKMWPRVYTQMYESIRSGFKKYDLTLKPMVSYNNLIFIQLIYPGLD